MNLTLTEPTAHAPAPARAPKVRRPGAVWRALLTANFLALIGAALLLRGWQLGNVPGLNGDEAWLGVQAAHLAAGEPIAWRTPTGNPVNLFLLLPVAALHLVFAPSVVVLRSMAVVSGVAALGVNFWLCRRVFDRRTALVSTAVLAVLPIAIAYSRFAWDTCQTLLATTLLVYFALATVEPRSASKAGQPGKKKQWFPAAQTPPDWLPALLAFGAMIWIHPTNIFALWLLIVPAASRYGHDWRAAARTAWERTGERCGRLKYLLAVVTLGTIAAVGAWFCRGLLWTAGSRLVDLGEAELFLQRLVRLFSGGTILEFIPGPARTSPQGLPPLTPETADVAFVLLTFVSAFGLAQRLRRPDSGRERCLACAVMLMIGTFYLVAGAAALAPHFERYGMCLVAPVGVLLSLGWSQWLGKLSLGPKTDRSRYVVLTVAAWLWLAHFYCDYFLAFRSNGGTSHVAFRTAAIEPKLAALETIVGAEEDVSRRPAPGPGKQIWIVADSWWSLWPLAYFSAPRRDIHVVAEEQWPAESAHVSPADAVWRVKFVAADGSAVPTLAAVAKDRSVGKTMTDDYTIRDYAGKPLLTIQRVAPR